MKVGPFCANFFTRTMRWKNVEREFGVSLSDPEALAMEKG
jgi:hypothetical protein